MEAGKSLALMTPGQCLIFGQKTNLRAADLSLAESLVLLLVLAPCAAVVGAVDLVAFPFLAAAQEKQGQQIGRVVAACPIRNPIDRMGEEIARGLEAKFGFQPAASAGRALVFEIRTDRLAWSGHLEWSGTVILRDDGDAELWKSNECEARGSDRSPDAYRADCPTLEKDLDSMISKCAAGFLAQLGAATGAPSRTTPE